MSSGPSTSGSSTSGSSARAALPREIGARAEEAVAAHLAARGLVVLATNLRVGRLELDVVAREGAVIVIVEVRTRGEGAWVRALDSIDAKKRAKVRAAGERLWRDRFAKDASIERMRFDAAAVSWGEGGEVEIEIVRAAF